MTKLKKLDDNNGKSLDTENKFLNPIWLWGKNKTRYQLYMWLDG